MTCTIGWIIIVVLLVIAIIKCNDKLPTKREDKINKGKILIIAVILVIIILLTYFWYSINFYYEIDIERRYSNNAEKEAIQKAEDVDIASIFNISRYYYEQKQTNSPSREPTANVWPNLADKEVLNFYQNKIDKLKNNFISVRATYEYIAEGKEYSDISIIYDNLTHRIIINDNPYIIDLAENPSSDLFQYCAIYYNNSLHVISTDTPSAHINLSNGYIVTQDFYYWEQYDYLAGFGGGAEQIIVLDQNYQLELLLLRTLGYGIS